MPPLRPTDSQSSQDGSSKRGLSSLFGGSSPAGSSGGGSKGGFSSFLDKGLKSLSETVGDLPGGQQAVAGFKQLKTQWDPRETVYTRPLSYALSHAKKIVSAHQLTANETKTFSKLVYQYGQKPYYIPGAVPTSNPSLAGSSTGPGNLKTSQTTATGLSSDPTLSENDPRGKEHPEDIKDTTDRLAYLIYQSGEIEAEYANKVEQARTAFKDIKRVEEGEVLTKLRNQKTAILNALNTLRAEHPVPNSTNIARTQKLANDLNEVNSKLSVKETELEDMKRKKIKECFELQFKALREAGEKRAILAGWGEVLLRELNGNGQGQYDGEERTAEIRSRCEDDLKAWRGDQPRIPTPQLGQALPSPVVHASRTSSLAAGSSLSAKPSIRKSFAETHKNELDSLGHDLENSHGSDPDSAADTVPPTAAASLSTPSAASAPTPASATVLPAGGSLPPINLAPTPAVSSQSPTANPTSPSTTNIPSPPTTTGASPLPPSALMSTSPSSSASVGAGPAPTIGSTLSATDAPPFVTPPSQPTVAETGDPITGTGGPSEGQLQPKVAPPTRPDITGQGNVGGPSSTSISSTDAVKDEPLASRPTGMGSLETAQAGLIDSSVTGAGNVPNRPKTKEEEAAEDRERRWAEVSRPGVGTSASASGAGQAANVGLSPLNPNANAGTGTGTGTGTGAGLSRMTSTARRRLHSQDQVGIGGIEGEDLPAYEDDIAEDVEGESSAAQGSTSSGGAGAPGTGTGTVMGPPEKAPL